MRLSEFGTLTTPDLARAIVASLARYRQPVVVYLPRWDLRPIVLHDLAKALAFATHSGWGRWEGPTWNEFRVLIGYPPTWRVEAVDALVEHGLGRSP